MDFLTKDYITNSSPIEKLNFMKMEKECFRTLLEDIMPSIFEALDGLADTVLDVDFFDQRFKEKSEHLAFGFDGDGEGYITYDPFTHLEEKQQPLNHGFMFVSILFDDDFILNRKATLKELKKTCLELHTVYTDIINCINDYEEKINSSSDAPLKVPKLFLGYFEKDIKIPTREDTL